MVPSTLGRIIKHALQGQRHTHTRTHARTYIRDVRREFLPRSVAGQADNADRVAGASCSGRAAVGCSAKRTLIRHRAPGGLNDVPAERDSPGNLFTVELLLSAFSAPRDGTTPSFRKAASTPSTQTQRKDRFGRHNRGPGETFPPFYTSDESRSLRLIPANDSSPAQHLCAAPLRSAIVCT